MNSSSEALQLAPEEHEAASVDIGEINPPVHTEEVQVTVVKQFKPTLAQCNQGGWIITIPGYGVCARTTLEEAMEYLAVMARDQTNENVDLPNILRHTREASRQQYARRGLYTIAAAMAGLLAGGLGLSAISKGLIT